MMCVCKTKELAKEICESKVAGLFYKEIQVKIDTRCPHFRNDDGRAWCEKYFWVKSNSSNTDCERKCRERYEI